jgi:hypothetical protein
MRLARVLTPSDQKEIYNMSGYMPAEGLRRAIDLSDDVRTAEGDNGHILGIWGKHQEDRRTPLASVWFMPAPEVARIPVNFTRIVRSELQRYSRRGVYLFGYADANNAVHVRWVQRLGFQILRKIERFGVNPAPFYEFIGQFPGGKKPKKKENPKKIRKN